MANQYTVSQEDIQILLEKWPDAKMYFITELDIFNTDGMAEGSKFKIEFIQNDVYISSVYIKENGLWFSTVDNFMIKKIMQCWITTITSNIQVPDAAGAARGKC